VQTDLQFWKIYLDTCCLSRFFDDQTQTRIRQEAEVISLIISQFRTGHWYWVSSDVLVHEVEQIRDLNQRFQIRDWLTDVHQRVSLGEGEISRGKQLEILGFKELDALHLACAESGSVDIFLTTDDRLLRRAKRDDSHLCVRVENPYAWFQEVTKSEPAKSDR
jgi:predicted nucleic acid-binding protein